MQQTSTISGIIILCLVFTAASASSSSQSPSPYELIHVIDDITVTVQTGSITLKCRYRDTANYLDISEISFFLNRTSASDPGLRERGDITVVPVGSTGIKFNLTRRLEGNYTCGKRVDIANVRESPPKTFISFQTTAPLLRPIQTNFTAMSGDRVILPCSIKPGALLQQYSVIWKKDYTLIAMAINPQEVTRSQLKYDIDRATYSLIIDSANTNDTSSSYKCDLSVQTPNTDTKTTLRLSPEVSGISLTIIEKQNQTTAEPITMISRDPDVESSTTFWCMCNKKKPS